MSWAFSFWSIFFFQDTADVDEEIKKISQNFPYLIVLKSLETYNFVVVVENEIFVETETLVYALMYLFATYYSFNMAYPQGCYSVLILFQKYILGIGKDDKQSVPKSVREAVTVMRRL